MFDKITSFLKWLFELNYGDTDQMVLGEESLDGVFCSTKVCYECLMWKKRKKSAVMML